MIVPLLLIVTAMQAKLTVAFNTARTRVGEMLSEVSESVMGAAVVRAYGLDEHTDRKVKRRDRPAVSRRDRGALPRGDPVAACRRSSTRLALSVVVLLGAFYGSGWGLTFGEVTAFLFLADVFLHVFTDLPEVYAETQTAIAGWRKILAVLDLPVEIVEPDGRRGTATRRAFGRGSRPALLLPRGAGGAARHLADGAGRRPRGDRRRDRAAARRRS